MSGFDPELSDTENLCNALHAIAGALRDLRVEKELAELSAAIRDGFDRLADSVVNR